MPKRMPKVDPQHVMNLAQLGATATEIGIMCRVSADYIEKNFRAQLDEGRTNLKVSLRRTQIRMALGSETEKPNVTMLVWLGKNILKQSDIPPPAEIKREDDMLEIDKKQLTDELAKLTRKTPEKPQVSVIVSEMPIVSNNGSTEKN
jgi:hypothetical protein